MAYRQYYLAADNPLDRAFTRGERRLMLATLEDGISTILDAEHHRTTRKQRLQDLAWLTSDDPRPPFGFLSLCDFLGIDPDYLRARVLAACPREHLEQAASS